jgi:hypothetical protein
MNGGYLPQHITKARRDGRMLGQVRDLLIMRRPLSTQNHTHMPGLLVDLGRDCAPLHAVFIS